MTSGANFPRAGIVTGLAAEAAILRRAANFAQPDMLPFIACAGADAQRARSEARKLIAKGANVLISFGVAGGLDPLLRPGRLIFPEFVAPIGGEAIPTDAAWREHFLDVVRRDGLDPAGGVLVESPTMISSPSAKRDLYRNEGAEAVDQESYALAQAARAAGLPFLALRAVADPAERALPPAALDSLSPEGKPRTGRVIAKLCLRPWEVPAILELRRDFAAALAALARLTQVAGMELFGGG